MDKATSPFTKYVTKLEVGPPGQAAKITTPTANSGETGKNIANRKPTTGTIINWAIRPIITALGLTKILVKSFTVSPNPMPNMIINKAKGRNTAVKKLDSIAQTPDDMRLSFYEFSCQIARVRTCLRGCSKLFNLSVHAILRTEYYSAPTVLQMLTQSAVFCPWTTVV
jgi:hypothetical protein